MDIIKNFLAIYGDKKDLPNARKRKIPQQKKVQILKLLKIRF